MHDWHVVDVHESVRAVVHSPSQVQPSLLLQLFCPEHDVQAPEVHVSGLHWPSQRQPSLLLQLVWPVHDWHVVEVHESVDAALHEPSHVHPLLA